MKSFVSKEMDAATKNLLTKKRRHLEKEFCLPVDLFTGAFDLSFQNKDSFFCCFGPGTAAHGHNVCKKTALFSRKA